MGVKSCVKTAGAFAVFIIFSCSIAQGSVLSYRNNSKQLGLGEDSFEPEYALSPQARGYRKSKFFPLFTIVRFTNEVCRTTAEEDGICFTNSQCTYAGGSAQGTCAQGLGVCCKIVANCGSIITQNATSFQNPNYPSKYSPTNGANVCQVRIRRQTNVCQLRLNFIAFDVDGPVGVPSAANAATTNNAGTCATDSLAITASSGTIPTLCGNMNGQHIYVDFGSSDTITLNLLLSGSVIRDRQWNIEVLMIPCKSVDLAPSGCLQWFRRISGQVQSFNYQGGLHLANLDYSICVRPDDGMRFIDWSPCTPGDVKIDGSPATSPTMPTACTTTLADYLTIMGGVSYPLQTAQAATPAMQSLTDRFCDVTWPSAVPNAYVRSPVRPFILHVKTDGGELTTANTDASVGFCMKWQQNPQ